MRSHERLGLGLAALERSRAGRRTQRGNVLGPQPVGKTIDQRLLGTDDSQIHSQAASQVDEARQIVTSHTMTLGLHADPFGPWSGVDLVSFEAPAPTQRVFPAAATDDEDLCHGFGTNARNG
jgi:hypothetical protein